MKLQNIQRDDNRCTGSRIHQLLKILIIFLKVPEFYREAIDAKDGFIIYHYDIFKF